MHPHDTALPRPLDSRPTDASAPRWGWAINPKQSAHDNLLAARRYYRDRYGGELVRAVMRSELAARMPAELGIEIEIDDQVAVGCMLFERGEGVG